jgi:hypothetical protein
MYGNQWNSRRSGLSQICQGFPVKDDMAVIKSDVDLVKEQQMEFESD